MPFTQVDPLVQRLLDAINVVGSDLSLPIVLRRIAETARELVFRNFCVGCRCAPGSPCCDAEERRVRLKSR